MRDVILERRYVGALMLDPGAADRAGVGLDDITDREARRALECVYALRDRGVEVNPDTLDLELSRRGYDRERQLNVMGWAHGLDDVAAVAARLRELSEARAIESVAAEVVRVARETGDPAKCREHMRELLDLGRRSSPSDRVKTFREVCVATAEALMDPKTREGMRIGWASVDRVYRLTRGQLMVLGAQTNVGKTSAFATWALHLAQVGGEPVGVISVEDGAEDWGAKWIGEVSGVNPEALWKGTHGMPGDELARSIADAVKAGVPLHFSEVADRSLDSVLADMAHMKHAHGVKAIFIDYLQAISLPNGAKDMRMGTDRILDALMRQAGVLKVALVLACQLSRPPKEKPYREPTKHDLKESGTLENRAQCIVMLWRGESGEVLGKIEKAKRTSFSTAPFKLSRRAIDGRLHEVSEIDAPHPWTEGEVWGD